MVIKKLIVHQLKGRYVQPLTLGGYNASN